MAQKLCKAVVFLIIAFALVGISSAQSSFSGIWHLDSASAADTSGRGALAIPIGTSVVSGKYDKALNFDGVNDAVYVLGISLNPSKAITLETWAYVKGDGFYPSLISKGNVGLYYESYALYLNPDGSVGFLLNSKLSAAGRTIINGPVIKKNVWTHIAGTYDGTTMRIFVNGQEVASGAHAGGIAQTLWPLEFGKSDRILSGLPDSYFKGALDEVRIWNRALTPGELMGSAQAGLRALWHFNETIGIAADASGFGNAATPTGATAAKVGKFGGARGLNSISGSQPTEYFTVANDSTLEPTQLTVDTWVNGYGQSQPRYSYLVAKGAKNCDYASYALYTGPAESTVNFYIGDAATFHGVSAPLMPDSNWHHVAGTFDGQKVRIYVDGEFVAEDLAPNPIEYNLGVRDFFVGRYGTDCVAGYSGAVDETRVWARPLSPGEIKALYRAGSGMYLPAKIDEDPGTGVYSSRWDANGGANSSANALGFVIPDAPLSTIAGTTFKSVSPYGTTGSLDLTGWSDYSVIVNGTRVNAKTVDLFTFLNTAKKVGMQVQWPSLQ
jgi:hypothetical protein